MNLKIFSTVWIFALILEINAGPYSFRSVNGKNELIIDKDYLESKKEVEIRKLKATELRKLKNIRLKRERKKKRKKRKARKLRSKKYLQNKIKSLLYDLMIFCILKIFFIF